MAADERIILFGEDVGAAGGVFKATEGLQERFDPDRVLDTPISEQAIVGAALGCALRGARPVVEIMFADFAGVCFDGIANELAKYRYMTGGQVRLAVTVRLANGAGGGTAQHSQSVENWFLNIPGLKIVTPATPDDAYWLLRAAISTTPIPCCTSSTRTSTTSRGPWATSRWRSEAPPSCARAPTSRSSQASRCATARSRPPSYLTAQGISAEIIDPRTIMPFDLGAVVASVSRTARLLCIQECSQGGSWGATLIAALVGEHLELLDAPPRLVGGDETPIPYAGELEARVAHTQRRADRRRGSAVRRVLTGPD